MDMRSLGHQKSISIFIPLISRTQNANFAGVQGQAGRQAGRQASRHLFCVAVHQDDLRVKDGNPLL